MSVTLYCRLYDGATEKSAPEHKRSKRHFVFNWLRDRRQDCHAPVALWTHQGVRHENAFQQGCPWQSADPWHLGAYDPSPAAVAGDSGPAFSETAVISAENVSHSGCFVTRVASEAGQVG